MKESIMGKGKMPMDKENGEKKQSLNHKTGHINNIKSFVLSAVIIFAIFLVVAISNTLTISAMTIKSAVASPGEIAPGENAKISIEIENTLRDDVENVNVALDLSGTVPVAPYQGSSEENVDEIQEGDRERFTFSIIVLPEASPGIYKIPVKISYEINGTKETKNGTIGIIVNSPPKIKISVEGYLIKGQEGKVEIRIINDGLSDLKLVSIQSTQPASGALINSPLYEYLGNIDSDDFETIEYSIFTRETSPSTILIPIKINYKDSTNKDFSQDEILNIRAYSQEEAKSLGLIERQNYTFYVAIGIIILLYLAYRIRKRMKRKKALGA